MLAHLEDFDLSALLEDFDVLHVLLAHLLDCHLDLIRLVRPQFDEPKLALTQGAV